jgi:hypothetical protein
LDLGSEVADSLSHLRVTSHRRAPFAEAPPAARSVGEASSRPRPLRSRGLAYKALLGHIGVSPAWQVGLEHTTRPFVTAGFIPARIRFIRQVRPFVRSRDVRAVTEGMDSHMTAFASAELCDLACLMVAHAFVYSRRSAPSRRDLVFPFLRTRSGKEREWCHLLFTMNRRTTQRLSIEDHIAKQLLRIKQFTQETRA